MACLHATGAHASPCKSKPSEVFSILCPCKSKPPELVYIIGLSLLLNGLACFESLVQADKRICSENALWLLGVISSGDLACAGRQVAMSKIPVDWVQSLSGDNMLCVVAFDADRADANDGIWSQVKSFSYQQVDFAGPTAIKFSERGLPEPELWPAMTFRRTGLLQW